MLGVRAVGHGSGPMSQTIRTLIRMTLVALIGATMGYLGVLRLDNNDFQFTSAGYVWIICVSAVMWVALSFLLARCNLLQTITVGLLSPLLGGMLVCPIGSHVFLIANWDITFPLA